MQSMVYPTRPRFSFEQFLLSVVIGLFIFTMSLVTFVLGYQVWYAGRIFPGVTVAGIDVSGLNPQQAAEKIAAGVTFPHDGKILLRDGDHIWNTTPEELGLYLDPQSSARHAFDVGRQGWFVARLQAEFYTWYSGRDLPPVFILDERTTYLYLNGLAKEIDKPTIEASIDLKGTEVEVHPGQVGRSLDVPKTLTLVSLQIQSMRDSVINVFINESAPVIMDATQQAKTAQQILSQPLKLSLPPEDPHQAGPWTIDQQTLAPMLTFERVQSAQGMQYQINLRTDTLRSYLDQLAPSLSFTPSNPLMRFNNDTKQLEVMQPAVIGRELDVEGSIQSIQEKLSAGEHNISLVMKYNNPPVTDQSTAESLGIRELIHSETSYFYGSTTARVQNITTAAGKFNGVLVAPGEVFSMATVLGDITLDNGYAEALIILGDQTIKGVGGGVCQVSTTLFRAAFFAGFPIPERHAHAYRVYYYEKVAGNRINTNFAGLDATVYVPLVDFKFTNDTPNWLLMETQVDPASSSITWNFYSTSDGRTVDWTTTGLTNITPPPPPVYHENSDLPSGTINQVDYAVEGADVTINRTVYRNNQVYLEDSFYTHYQAWPDGFDYGPGTEIPNQNDSNKPQG